LYKILCFFAFKIKTKKIFVFYLGVLYFLSAHEVVFSILCPKRLLKRGSKMTRRFQTSAAALPVAAKSRRDGRIEELTALGAVLVFSTLVTAIYIATFAETIGG